MATPTSMRVFVVVRASKSICRGKSPQLYNVRAILSNPNDVSPAASNLFFGVPFFGEGGLGLRAIAGPKHAYCNGWFGVQFL